MSDMDSQSDIDTESDPSSEEVDSDTDADLGYTSWSDNKTKADLRAALDDIDKQSLGSFATSGIVPNSANPGLDVKGIGGIGLPLSARDAVEISKVCRQSPFGKGSETVVDTSVRKTWELNPSQFELQNPDWQRCIQGLVIRISNELGVAGGNQHVRAELYKMLLYEEGAFFESHKDSEKAPGMFATLVVALPSSHEGGDVETSFGDHKQSLKTSPSSNFGFSYLAW